MNIRIRLLHSALAVLIGLAPTQATQAQTQFAWPVEPFHESQEITGTFAEYRSTSPSGHFHNGTDIPKADGSPVYPVKDGIVTSMSPEGSNAFVRVQDVAYVHIFPNPAISIGDSVFASETILGTILPGLGHVHFTNGFVGSEKNSMLPNSGLTPYEDPWPPIIRFVQFYQNATTNQFSTNELSGLVDIVVKVDEQNGPPTARTSRLNNGTYKIGYKILSADTSTVVFEPPNDGLRFQFDTKPNNAFVNIAYFRSLSSTTSHAYQVTNDVGGDNFWNTAAMPEGVYVVMAFTADTRGNTDTAYVAVTTTEADLEAPAPPTLRILRETDAGFSLGWVPNQEDDLLGYRMYFSFNNETWSLFRNENVLTPAVTDTSIDQILNRDVYFRLTAVDGAPVPNESIVSDVYGMSNGAFLQKVLIVDGFDRTDGDWTEPSHDFVFAHGQALIANQISFDAAANETVADSSVQLDAYEAVFWLLGDESIANEAFSEQEQERVRAYLEHGGALFVSGANVAWSLDLDNGSDMTTAEDEQFLQSYLRADLVSDTTESRTVAGVSGTIFEGLTFDFGTSPYVVQRPDAIATVGDGTIACLQYDDGQTAGLQYAGPFGESATPAKLVYLALPFETITGAETRTAIMARVVDFFFDITSVESAPDLDLAVPAEITLLPNYPNPFNPQTAIEFRLPAPARVTIEIHNLRGQLVRTLVDGVRQAGTHKTAWDGFDEFDHRVASGSYVLRLQAEETDSKRVHDQSRIMTLIK